MSLPVGMLVRLKCRCLGNDPGTIGYVFDDYGDGCQVIFPNGEYCGFGDVFPDNDEVKIYFDIVKQSGLNYLFTHVIKLSRDFKDGYFKEAFNHV